MKGTKDCKDCDGIFDEQFKMMNKERAVEEKDFKENRKKTRRFEGRSKVQLIQKPTKLLRKRRQRQQLWKLKPVRLSDEKSWKKSRIKDICHWWI